MKQIFIGRQAIYDRRLRVYGYELLYREGNTLSAPGMNGTEASARVILNAFMEMGLERIVGQRRAFINLTRDFFTELPPIPFEREQVVLEVLEVLEDIETDHQLVENIAQLAGQGYLLALDDFEFEEKWDQLLPLVQIIKVEIPAVDLAQLPRKVYRLRKYGVRLLAEKVETQAEYQALHDMGFDYFQGYYFSRPQIVHGRRITENQAVTLRLLTRLSDKNVSTEELVELISHDPGLSFKILRYLNSAAVGLHCRIASIRQAIIYLGLERLRAWSVLAAMAGVRDKPLEILRTALVRSHMCKALVATADPEQAEMAFATGLLSILELLMDRPLKELILQLPLAKPISQAILRHEGVCGEALGCAIAVEQHDWPNIRFTGLDQDAIQEIFLQSSEQAFREQTALTD
ncbi:EAL and HDOD domain-containing protein [Thiolapillus sp.]|uniref:EAL and HDOD domain-containing protein n=3 Tax=Thiolapillus sp. TaxID=2017437 RepID=UPI0025D5AE2E|nr:HDOD domain-containing protein [Thiolapillus sp.]